MDKSGEQGERCASGLQSLTGSNRIVRCPPIPRSHLQLPITADSRHRTGPGLPAALLPPEQIRFQARVLWDLVTSSFPTAMAQRPKIDPHVGQLGYLQALVTEFQETESQDAKEQVLINLVNFSYDPGNYEYLWELQILFLDSLSEKNEIVKFAIWGASATCPRTRPTRSTFWRPEASRSSSTVYPAPTRSSYLARAAVPSSPPRLWSSACCAFLSQPTHGSERWPKSS